MKNFDEIYKKLCSENYGDLEEIRLKEKRKIKIIIAIVICILIVIPIIFITNPQYVEVIIIVFFPLCFGIAFIGISSFLLNKFFNSSKQKPKKKTYDQLYKERIVAQLISDYDNYLRFSYEKSIPRGLYNQGLFESYDIYHSDDLVYGKIDGIIDFEMGDIHTEDESTDSDGNTTYYTIFRGLFSSARLDKSINNTIKIRSDKGAMGKGLSKKFQIQMDSMEFEKNFDIYSTDNILAMRILTSDIMDYMVSFKTNNKVKYEVTITGQELYIRIHCSNMFEGSVFQNSLDEKTLKQYYTYLDFMCELNKKFYKVISEKDI